MGLYGIIENCHLTGGAGMAYADAVDCSEICAHENARSIFVFTLTLFYSAASGPKIKMPHEMNHFVMS